MLLTEKTIQNNQKNCPFISIVIPVKNEELLIGQCLESLKKLNYPRDKMEIIISDGLSNDNTVKIAQNYGAKVVENKIQTVAPGRNIGFAISKGDLVAFSDADCVMDKNWLNNSLKYFKDEKVGGVGGPNLPPPNESYFEKAVRILFSLGSLISGSAHAIELKKIKSVEGIPGCNAVYKREVLKKAMPVDESLLTCDDVEMNYKIIREGYKLLYAPDVVVWHYRRDNPRKFWKQIYRYAVGRLQLGKKRKETLGFFHVLFGFFIPIFCFSFFFLYIFNFDYLLFFIKIISVFILIYFLSFLIQRKPFKLAFNVFLAFLIFIFAWSAGFLKELIFPVKNAKGK